MVKFCCDYSRCCWWWCCYSYMFLPRNVFSNSCVFHIVPGSFSSVIFTNSLLLLCVLYGAVFTHRFSQSFASFRYLLQAAPEWLKNYSKSSSDSYESSRGYVCVCIVGLFLDHTHTTMENGAAHKSSILSL